MLQSVGNRTFELVVNDSLDTSDMDTDTHARQRTAHRQGHSPLAVAKAAGATVAVLVVSSVLGQRALGWIQDRMEDRRVEQPEYKKRCHLIRWFRNSLPRAELSDWLDAGLLGGTMRLLFLPAYSAVFERELRRAIPEGPTVWRWEIIFVHVTRDTWLHVSAVLDPFAGGMGLTMTLEMAATLGVHPGQQLPYSVAGHEFSGPVTVQALPDMAAAIQLAQRDATAANQQLTQGQLQRRAAEIIAERERCVAVPAEVLRHLLRARFSINMS